MDITKCSDTLKARLGCAPPPLASPTIWLSKPRRPLALKSVLDRPPARPEAHARRGRRDTRRLQCGLRSNVVLHHSLTPPITGTLGYVLSPDGAQVLMIHRNARPEDEHLGKYNGLGGKLEVDEDIAAGMVREIREEAGIECTHRQLRGTVSWPGFGRNGEDWLGFVFLVTAWTGVPLESNQEGTLEWKSLDRLADLPM